MLTLGSLFNRFKSAALAAMLTHHTEKREVEDEKNRQALRELARFELTRHRRNAPACMIESVEQVLLGQYEALCESEMAPEDAMRLLMIEYVNVADGDVSVALRLLALAAQSGFVWDSAADTAEFLRCLYRRHGKATRADDALEGWEKAELEEGSASETVFRLLNVEAMLDDLARVRYDEAHAIEDWMMDSAVLIDALGLLEESQHHAEFVIAQAWRATAYVGKCGVNTAMLPPLGRVTNHVQLGKLEELARHGLVTTDAVEAFLHDARLLNEFPFSVLREALIAHVSFGTRVLPAIAEARKLTDAPSEDTSDLATEIHLAPIERKRMHSTDLTS